MNKQKKLLRFEQRLYLALEALNQTSLAMIVASAALESFPQNVPSTRKKPIEEVLLQLATDLQTAIAHADEISEGETEPSIVLTTSLHGSDPAGLGAAMMFAMRIMSGQESLPIDFGDLLRRNEIAMLYAHLDAFMIDALRAMCSVKPQLLARKKQILWADVIKARSRRALIDELAEQYAFEFGWKSFDEKLAFLREEHGVVLTSSKETLRSISEGELLRHVILHNNGKASSEYLRRSGRADLQIGEEVPFGDEEIRRLRWNLAAVCTDLYAAIAAKYFSAGPSKMRIGSAGPASGHAAGGA